MNLFNYEMCYIGWKVEVETNLSKDTRGNMNGIKFFAKLRMTYATGEYRTCLQQIKHQRKQNLPPFAAA
jgi:hypothetical protein